MRPGPPVLPGTVEVDGCTVRYVERGPTDLPAVPDGGGSAGATDPTVVLVHGAAAHAGWWVRVAPWLLRHRVVTLDLSGHGDSGHRERYGPDTWADEVAAVVRRVDRGPVVVVGHSMGGMVALATAARTPALVAAVVLVDTRLPLERPQALPSTTIRYAATAAEALDRFRLLPAGTSADPDLLRAVAGAGLVETGAGWRWKHDARARHRFTNARVDADLARITCPVGYVHGTDSAMGGPRSAAYLERGLGRPVLTEAVARAHHHVPLDEPEACAAAIRGIIDRGLRVAGRAAPGGAR